MQEMRITPDLPVYAELVDKLFFELMDGRPITDIATPLSYADLESARTRSLSRCEERGGKNCAFLVWSRNGCAALALNADKYSAWYGATPAEAEKGALERTGGKRGIAALCIGGGEATAMAVELVD